MARVARSTDEHGAGETGSGVVVDKARHERQREGQGRTYTATGDNIAGIDDGLDEHRGPASNERRLVPWKARRRAPAQQPPRGQRDGCCANGSEQRTAGVLGLDERANNVAVAQRGSAGHATGQHHDVDVANVAQQAIGAKRDAVTADNVESNNAAQGDIDVRAAQHIDDRNGLDLLEAVDEHDRCACHRSAHQLAADDPLQVLVLLRDAVQLFLELSHALGEAVVKHSEVLELLHADLVLRRHRR